MSYPMQQSVSSSNIAKAAHDGANLFLLFNSGVAYSYAGVPEEVYRALVEATSVGSYFHKYVRNVFRYQRLEAHQF